MTAEPVRGKISQDDDQETTVCFDMTSEGEKCGVSGGFDPSDSTGQVLPMTVATFPSSSSSCSTIGTAMRLNLPSKPTVVVGNRARLNSFDDPLLPSPTASTPGSNLSSATSNALRRLHDLTQEMQRNLDDCRSRITLRRGSVPVVPSPMVGIPAAFDASDVHSATLRAGWERRRSPDGREASHSWRSSGSDDRDGISKGLPPPFPPSLRPVEFGDENCISPGNISVPNLTSRDKLMTSTAFQTPKPMKATPRVGLSSLGAKRQQQLRKRRQRNLTAAANLGRERPTYGDGKDDYATLGSTPDGRSVNNNINSSMRNSVSFCGIDGRGDQTPITQPFMNLQASNGDPETPQKTDSLVDVLHRRYYSHQYIPHSRSRPFLHIASFDQSNVYLQPRTLNQHSEQRNYMGESKGLYIPKSKSMNDASMHGFSADVVEACRWLIEAGFPQYSQMFEDGSFPIDLDTIREDHRFMDDDALSALFRRINTLNNFVETQRQADAELMAGEAMINKMGRVVATFDNPDGDGGEEFALSRNWQFERDTRRWSRVDDPAALIGVSGAAQVSDNVDANGHTESAGLSRGRSRASKRTGGGHSGEDSSRSLLRSASLRLRSAVSRFRRGDLNFRSLRRAKKPSPSSVLDVETTSSTIISSSSATPLTISNPIPISVPGMATQSSTSPQRPSAVAGTQSSTSPQRSPAISGSRVGPHAEVAKSTPEGNGNCMQILVNDTIDTGSGDKINIRTGSFMGKSGHRYEAFLRWRNENSSPSPTASTTASSARKHESSPAEIVRDSNGGDDDTPGAELDRILQALYTDIDMLNEMMDSGRSTRVTSSSVSAPTSPRLLDVPSSGESCPSTDALAQFTEVDAYDLDAQISELKRLERLRRGDTGRGSLDRGTSSSRGHSSDRENSLDSSTPFRSAASTLRRNAPSRWSSVERTCRQSVYQQDQSIGGMSVKQLILLRKIALLKLTTIMEKHCPPHKSLFSWAFPKILRRGRSHSETDCTSKVFGVSLSVCLQRTGMFLPKAILNALAYLRNDAKTAHGIFRRAGGKARTLALREQIDKNPMLNDFSSWQPYDVADVVKLYFRELPECLLTNKLSSTLINIFIYLPLDLRLEALQWVVLRLPDENRLVLQCLLQFLRDMSEFAEVTQMPASNLAMCLAPTLFNFPHALPSGLSPKRLRRVTGSPDPKDLADQKAAHECLTVMIQFSHQLFLISESILNQCQFDSDELGEPPPLNVLAPPRSDSIGRDWQSWAGERLSSLLRDCREKGRGWVHVQTNQASVVEIHHKKVNDGHPLKLWRCVIDVEAPPEDLLHRLWNERCRWDQCVTSQEVLECLSEDAEVIRRSHASLCVPNPGRECVMLRARQCGLEGGAAALLSSSILVDSSFPHPVSHSNNLNAFVMQEDVLLDPCGTGKCRIHWLSRVDVRGFTVEWYGSSWGNYMAHLLLRLQESFVKSISSRETSL